MVVSALISNSAIKVTDSIQQFKVKPASRVITISKKWMRDVNQREQGAMHPT